MDGFRALLLYRLARVALPNWALVGRWVMYLPRGRVFHNAISAAQPQPRELQIVWAFYYLFGVIYGVVFTFLAGSAWVAESTFLPVFVCALVTIAAGWFLLHPGLGLGWAASKADSPSKVRIMGLVSHSVFGWWLFWPQSVRDTVGDRDTISGTGVVEKPNGRGDATDLGLWFLVGGCICVMTSLKKGLKVRKKVFLKHE